MDGNLLPWPNFKPFFFLDAGNISECGTKYNVLCHLCLPVRKLLSVSKTSSSNLRRHMQKIHPTHMTYLEKIGSGKKRRLEVSEDTCESDDEHCIPSISSKQTKLVESLTGHLVAQQKVNNLVIDYVIRGLHSFMTVERPEFQDLVTGLHPGRAVVSRTSLAQNIALKSENLKRHLKSIISQTKFVATTADCWRSLNRTYIGITIHWIDDITLDRRAAVLACRRLVKEQLTYHEIGSILECVNQEYDIQDKIVSTTVDNGLNFLQPFICVSDDELPDSDVDFEFFELCTILDSVIDEVMIYQLPSHERCVLHTMNLAVTFDTMKAELNEPYKKAMRGTLACCKDLWNTQASSTLHADLIKDKLGIHLDKPSDNIGNSVFDSLVCVSQILHEKVDAFHEICDRLGLTRLREADVMFIKEYCKVMKPVAIAFETLQCERNGFLGIVLPVLHALKRRLLKLKDSKLLFCSPLVEAILEGLDQRFSSVWFRKDLVLASVLHPEFQTNWIKDVEKETIAMLWLKDAVQEMAAQLEKDIPNQKVEAEDDDEELFDFQRPTSQKNDKPQWKLEFEQYLSFSAGQMKSLHAFPIIKELFLRYNTGVPSSAALEKVFSARSDIFTHKKGRLPDDNFENILQLKVGIK